MSRPPLAPAAPVPVRRGEVWWVDFDPTRGGEIRKTRPAVVLTANALNRVRRTVVVVPLSTGPAPRPPLVIATPSDEVGSVAVCDQLRAVDKGHGGKENVDASSPTSNPASDYAQKGAQKPVQAG